MLLALAQPPPVGRLARAPENCNNRLSQQRRKSKHQWRGRLGCQPSRPRPAPAKASAAASSPAPAATTGSYDALVRWCIEQRQLPPLAVEPAVLDGEPGVQRHGFVAARDVGQGEVLLQVPGSLAITAVDVGKDAQLEVLARGRSELVGLALWLMQERAKVMGLGRGILRNSLASFQQDPSTGFLAKLCRDHPQNGARSYGRCHRPR